MLYLESSALVKRYVLEVGTEIVQAAILADPFVATSMISAVEVRAALAAAARAGRIPDLTRLVGSFRGDWTRYIIIGVDAQLIDVASEGAERHALRGYAAVQLASALAVALTTPGLRFGTFDTALQRAAMAEGLALLTY